MKYLATSQRPKTEKWPAVAQASFSTIMASAIAIALAGCAAPAAMIPTSIDLPKKVRNFSQLQAEGNAATATRIGATPTPPVTDKLDNTRDKPTANSANGKPEVADITLAFEQIPLSTLIQSIYGTILKRNINVDATIVAKRDLVTLRSGAPQTPSQVEQTMRLLLSSYGIAVIEVNGLTRIVPNNTNLGYLPEIRRGRALPETPLPLRPIFQLVELESVRNSDVAGWLRAMFDKKVDVKEDVTRNAVLLSGTSGDVAAALEAIHILDQPLMKGRQSMRISPSFWSADELAKRLSEILQSEGYSAGLPTPSATLPITVLPVTAANAVFVFAASQKILNHVADWAKELDKPNEKSVGRNLFSYKVKYIDAEALARTLQQFIGGTAAPSAALSAAPGAVAAPGAGAASARAPQVVVDRGSNTLIFSGSNEDYGSIRNLLQTLDKPALQVMIEVTVAEVTLSDNNQLGVEWLVNQANLSGGRSASYGTQGGLSLGSAGFNFRLLDNLGDARLVINALASSNRATILSSPKIVARNGEAAVIQVGQEVPIITSQQVATTGSNNTINNTSTVPQSIQYRSTGVILNVKPVIHSGDRVDLDVSQEVSAAQATNTGVSTSPTFSTRKVQTKLSLKDGATILLGGLMSTNKNDGTAGIPYLKDIPWIGQLFRNDTGKNDRTELIILITPHIIADDDDAEAVTDAFRNMLGAWARPSPAAGKLPDTNKGAAGEAGSSKPVMDAPSLTQPLLPPSLLPTMLSTPKPALLPAIPVPGRSETLPTARLPVPSQ
ncbi:MAG: general secretion pathway protein D [Candidatus Paceibacteria bacterium]|jgi:general secretion pathway protein D